MKNNLVEFNQQERDLINILANELETIGPPGYLETALIAERLNISVTHAKSIIRSLFVKGIVDTDEIDTFAAYLTPEGFELARKD